MGWGSEENWYFDERAKSTVSTLTLNICYKESPRQMTHKLSKLKLGIKAVDCI